MVSAGKIGFKDVEGAFKDMTKEGGQFFNLMDDQSKTVGGRLSNLSDSWEQLKVNIGKSQSGILSGTVTFSYLGISFCMSSYSALTSSTVKNCLE